ncbi:DUF881 domain-containing protein [Bacillus carboniphilus]|uniref:DUF881 domain-containing protein n=1 Tax=Bacillus carboniphilus TaxID=86663 RepID=A0ABY9JYU9_9BACI|nr:DUF881 domain-containing protein [Bacillus carboniphilus]WLR43620.1 DUF881 domain-containing protein [Bacillus carboniphilus]
MERAKIRKLITFSLLSTVVGFLFVVQFYSVNQPEIRDTRNIWQLREDLLKEQERSRTLEQDIYKYEQLIANYETQMNDSPEKALKETLEQLKVEAGLTQVEGEGVKVTIDSLFNEQLGMQVSYVSPEIMQKLINELNSFGAEEIAVNNRRVVNSTVIRDINGVTKLDGYGLNSFPIQINILTDDVEKLSNRFLASTIEEDFAVDNLSIEITEPIEQIMIPAYDEPITVKYLSPLSEGGES